MNNNKFQNTVSVILFFGIITAPKVIEEHPYNSTIVFYFILIALGILSLYRLPKKQKYRDDVLDDF